MQIRLLSPVRSPKSSHWLRLPRANLPAPAFAANETVDSVFIAPPTSAGKNVIIPTAALAWQLRRQLYVFFYSTPAADATCKDVVAETLAGQNVGGKLQGKLQAVPLRQTGET